MNHYKPILAIDGFVVGAGITLQYFTLHYHILYCTLNSLA
jgi:hypothetical protein